MTHIRTFRQDPDHTMQPKFLSEAVYAEAMESMVIVNTDVVIIDPATRSLYLAKRKALPHSDWWIIGGRVMAGEPLEQAATRNFVRETKLQVSPESFRFITLYRYLWSQRSQEPQDAGSDNLAFTYALELSADQIKSISLDATEYGSEGLHKFNQEALQANHVHPMLIDLYRRIFPSFAVQAPKMV